jgi:hypothetical protein
MSYDPREDNCGAGAWRQDAGAHELRPLGVLLEDDLLGDNSQKKKKNADVQLFRVWAAVKKAVPNRRGYGVP